MAVRDSFDTAIAEPNHFPDKALATGIKKARDSRGKAGFWGRGERYTLLRRGLSKRLVSASMGMR